MRPRALRRADDWAMSERTPAPPRPPARTPARALVGGRYEFVYPDPPNDWSDYSRRSGLPVVVIEQVACSSMGPMFRVEWEDGWRGVIYGSDLFPLEVPA